MNDVNLAPENKEATPEHGYLMAYDKKEQKAKGVKGIAANGELETLEANEANRDQFIKVDQRGNFFTNFGKNFLYQYNNPGRYSLYNMPKETLVEQAKEKIEAAQEPQNEAVRRELASTRVYNNHRFNEREVNWEQAAKYGITPDRRTPSGIRAAIIREKGTNGEREMAYSLYLAGFDVKDVTMTDLISGRETLEDVNMIVYCGGFSNSDVLGSAKGWAGAFLFNPKAKEALDKYYAREDTLSLGVCNGCQLMMELNLINPEHKKNGKMLHNDSHKFESRFLGVTVPTNRSVMLGSLSGSKLGIWVAHGEGKFSLPYDEDKYNVVLKYSYDEYPSNPNGSDYSIAGLASADGRHLAMMPHLERAIFPWQNGCYPADRVNSDQITPWVEAFVNARKWVEANKK